MAFDKGRLTKMSIFTRPRHLYAGKFMKGIRFLLKLTFIFTRNSRGCEWTLPDGS